MSDHIVDSQPGEINQRLSRLLNIQPAALSHGGSQPLADQLWIWGVLGGKEVGKSSLINALAERDIVERAELAGEGTYQPAAYLAAQDVPAVRRRFDALSGIDVSYHPRAPEELAGLVLVDLPDFDSTFVDHAEQVREVAGVLDGIIWVTTPKKVSDLRAIAEIRQVLKSRTNFVYVVNKMDWLLGQSAAEPAETAERMRLALHHQIAACDAEGDPGRSFLISARCPTHSSMLTCIQRSRGGNGSVVGVDPGIEDAVDQVASDFARLKEALTTAPTAAAAEANKRANLDYQVSREASMLLEHYHPEDVLERFDRLIGDDELERIVTQTFPALYADHLLRHLCSVRTLLLEWSNRVFHQRLGFWPLLGIVALPLSLVTALWSSWRSFSRTSPGSLGEDPFRFDGIDLEDRIGAVHGQVCTALARVGDKIAIELPTVEELTRRFRSDVRQMSDQVRATGLQPLLRRTPSLPGRALRGIMPLAILLWFPLLQPVLAAFLPTSDQPSIVSLQTVHEVVALLSASTVLTGLVTSLLILALIAGAIYVGSMRDASRAIDSLAETTTAEDALHLSVQHSLHTPLHQFRDQLATLTRALQRLSGSS